MQVLIQYNCPRGHVVNVPHEGRSRREPGNPVAMTQLTCHLPAFPRTDEYAKVRGIEFGGTFDVLCPDHQIQMQSTRRSLIGRAGSDMCDESCLSATGHECKCSCQGMMHGVFA